MQDLPLSNSVDVRPVCGIIMPISAIDECTAEHWAEVKEIIFDAVANAGFTPSLVSDADDVGVIQKRIIQNIYENPICICDVSAKNPNVMFELGMRLAFDKPTIIIKDDKTSYSFDTSPIEHIGYPRDLRFAKICAFKAQVAQKIAATYRESQSNQNYTTFLKHFGEFKIAKIDEKEVSGQEYIIDQLKSMSSQIASIQNSVLKQEITARRRLVASRYADDENNSQKNLGSGNLIGSILIKDISQKRSVKSFIEDILKIKGITAINIEGFGEREYLKIYGHVDNIGRELIDELAGPTLIPF